MEIPNKLKLAGAGALLLAAVAVDFISSMMSIAFDLAFVAGAVWVVWPILFPSKKDED